MNVFSILHYSLNNLPELSMRTIMRWSDSWMTLSKINSRWWTCSPLFVMTRSEFLREWSDWKVNRAYVRRCSLCIQSSSVTKSSTRQLGSCSPFRLVTKVGCFPVLRFFWYFWAICIRVSSSLFLFIMWLCCYLLNNKFHRNEAKSVLAWSSSRYINNFN